MWGECSLFTPLLIATWPDRLWLHAEKLGDDGFELWPRATQCGAHSCAAVVSVKFPKLREGATPHADGGLDFFRVPILPLCWPRPPCHRQPIIAHVN